MADLEVTFLGTGTSHGIPVIGCQCRVCHSADPRDKRLRTAAFLRTPEIQLQIDTPPDFRTQCLREHLVRIDAVLYTHSHSDHILGFDDLRRFCEMEDKAIPVYGSDRTLKDLRRVFNYAFEPSRHYRTYVRPIATVISAPFSLGDLDITPVDLPHGRTISTGYVFSRQGRKLFAYFTDCESVPEPAIEAAKGVEVLVLDALRHAPHTTHMSLEQATAASEAITPGMTYFTHMCHDLGHEETERGLPETIRLAYDGLRIQIGRKWL